MLSLPDMIALIYEGERAILLMIKWIVQEGLKNDMRLIMDEEGSRFDDESGKV